MPKAVIYMKKNIISILIIIILLVVTVVRGVIYFSLKKEAVINKDKAAKVDEYKQRIIFSEMKLSRLKPQENVFNTKIPDVADSIELLKTIRNIAESAGISDVMLRLADRNTVILEGNFLQLKQEQVPDEAEGGRKKQKKIKERIQETGIVIDLYSSYVNLVRFLDQLKNLERLVTIEYLKINRDEKMPSKIKMHIQAKAYYLPSIERR
ncbi:MAG: type 4a pilus biogenesis protein PilO [Candidatus Omnitrophota bacterium]